MGEEPVSNYPYETSVLTKIGYAQTFSNMLRLLVEAH